MDQKAVIFSLLTILAMGMIHSLGAESAAPPPGTYSPSWLGNSFMIIHRQQWQVVSEGLKSMTASPSGTWVTPSSRLDRESYINVVNHRSAQSGQDQT